MVLLHYQVRPPAQWGSLNINDVIKKELLSID